MHYLRPEKKAEAEGEGGDPRWKPSPTGNVSYMLNAEVPDTALV